jgi:uncharacterized protein YjbI with pentapeptide repeats
MVIVGLVVVLPLPPSLDVRSPRPESRQGFRASTSSLARPRCRRVRSCGVARRRSGPAGAVGAPAPALVRAPEVPDELVEPDDDLTDDLRLEGIRLTGSWAGASFEGLDIRGARLSGVRFTGATLDQLLLRDVVAVDCELSGATLNAGVFERVRFERCRMSGLVATGLRARDVEMVDCVLDGAWLRSATFERCELAGCNLRGADLYGADLRDTRLVHSQLDETEWSKATVGNLALHGSTLDGLRGVQALHHVVIGTDQLLPLALPLLASLGVVVDDDYLTDMPAPRRDDG